MVKQQNDVYICFIIITVKVFSCKQSSSILTRQSEACKVLLLDAIYLLNFPFICIIIIAFIYFLIVIVFGSFSCIGQTTAKYGLSPIQNVLISFNIVGTKSFVQLLIYSIQSI